MKNSINKLLEKYWEGETSLAEEKELKDLLSKAEGYEEEKLFFKDIQTFAQIEADRLKLPDQKSLAIRPWLSMAAALLVFLIATFAFYRYQEKKGEEKAFLAVMEAFELINENMQKGTSQLEVMEDFKHLDKSHEIFNLKEQKQ